jgi:ribosome-binding protein aMBF1 (putative translation factor)
MTTKAQLDEMIANVQAALHAINPDYAPDYTKPTNTTIGQIIKKRREMKRWNQQELADKSTVTQATISRIEAEVLSDVKINTLRSLAAALGCLVVDLLPDTDKKKPSRTTDTSI